MPSVRIAMTWESTWFSLFDGFDAEVLQITDA